MDSLPNAIEGVEWTVSTEAPLAYAVTASAGGVEVARAELKLREVAQGEYRASIEGSVAAGWQRKGLGNAILAWGERASLAALDEQGFAGTVVLAANCDSPGIGAVALYEARGLALAVAEDEMARRLSDLPAGELPGDFTVLAWDEMSAPLFHHCYDAAFRTRPGFPGWEEARWREAFASGEEFRPGLSFVVCDGPEPVAYAVCWVEGESGWVTQMGVRPEARGKGLGAAMLSRALGQFAVAGLEEAVLEVATNNREAQRLYERLGFEVRHSWQSWRKTLR